jgi:hypothetical protein
VLRPTLPLAAEPRSRHRWPCGLARTSSLTLPDPIISPQDVSDIGAPTDVEFFKPLSGYAWPSRCPAWTHSVIGPTISSRLLLPRRCGRLSKTGIARESPQLRQIFAQALPLLPAVLAQMGVFGHGGSSSLLRSAGWPCRGTVCIGSPVLKVESADGQAFSTGHGRSGQPCVYVYMPYAAPPYGLGRVPWSRVCPGPTPIAV